MTVQKNLVRILKLGLMDYRCALEIQQKRCSSIIQSIASEKPSHDNCLILVEHPPVYTVGLRDKEYTSKDEQSLMDLGADFVRTNRGGLITFHGPGQLVIYPVIYLKDFNLGMRQYVANLEQVVISACSELGVHGQSSPCTGVWVGDRKIAAIGVHGSRFVTSHGVGLNCNTDLSWFNHIVPCGIKNKEVSSLSKESGRDISIGETIPHILKAFSDIFHCEYSDTNT